MALAATRENYLKEKERVRKMSAKLIALGNNLEKIPSVINPERKKKASKNFRFFCDSYFSETFYLPWSPDHLKIIKKLETVILKGGLFAMASPRGSGKTTLVETASIWAILFGHRRYVLPVSSDERSSLAIMESIKTELEVNDALLEDFPEVCFPVRALKGISHKCKGQHLNGVRTQIQWSAKRLVLPTIAGSKASGAIIDVAGITGHIRGRKFKRSDGTPQRPDLVLLDDPQTDESAKSVIQTADREMIIKNAVLNLAGPGKKIAALMPCTIIRENDLASRFLDRKKNPEWKGEITKLVYTFPENQTLWDRYQEIRDDGLRESGTIEKATEFYKKNRKAMDKGAKVAWPERYNEDEISALQHAINLRLRDEPSFFSEYQNEPYKEKFGANDDLDLDTILQKYNNIEQYHLPLGCQAITAFIDVHQKLLFYVVVAWESNFTGYIIDYQAWPRQNRRHYSLTKAVPTLLSKYGESGFEGMIYKGLETLTEDILGREYQRDDGAMLKVSKCLIDANWGQTTDVIYQFCRQSDYASVLLPAHGKYVGASTRPFSEYTKKKGERLGHNWRIPTTKGKRAIRHVLFDCNYWKSFTVTRLLTAKGDKGCLTLFGKDPVFHHLFAHHLMSEYRIKTEGRGRVVDEWRLNPKSCGDNHFWDCLVGSAVAASMVGIKLTGTGQFIGKKKKKLSLSEQREKMMKRGPRRVKGAVRYGG